MAELVDAKDLKSFGAMHRVGSTPTPGTNVFSELTSDLGVTLIERSGLKVAIRVAAGVP